MRFLFFVFTLIYGINGLIAQAPAKPAKHQIGILYGYGDQRLFDVNYHYRIHLFRGQYIYSLLRKSTWGLDIVVHPQWNITRLKLTDQATEETKGYEFGVNAGLSIRKKIYRGVSLYGGISSGPHYVSATPARQSNGFIFSDNFFAGTYIRLTENVELDLRLVVRHISNAGLENPNGGVNNLIFNGGFLIPLD